MKTCRLVEDKAGKYSVTRGKSILQEKSLISKGELQGEGRGGFQQESEIEEEGRRAAERQCRGTGQLSTQSSRRRGRRGDAVEIGGSPGCQNFSSDWKKTISGVFINVSP